VFKAVLTEKLTISIIYFAIFLNLDRMIYTLYIVAILLFVVFVVLIKWIITPSEKKESSSEHFNVGLELLAAAFIAAILKLPNVTKPSSATDIGTLQSNSSKLEEQTAVLVEQTNHLCDVQKIGETSLQLMKIHQDSLDTHAGFIVKNSEFLKSVLAGHEQIKENVVWFVVFGVFFLILVIFLNMYRHTKTAEGSKASRALLWSINLVGAALHFFFILFIEKH
jgi:heme/copper-type cytochrome/quinol oxidase subunit 2